MKANGLFDCLLSTVWRKISQLPYCRAKTFAEPLEAGGIFIAMKLTEQFILGIKTDSTGLNRTTP